MSSNDTSVNAANSKLGPESTSRKAANTMQITEAGKARVEILNHPTFAFDTHTYQGHITLMNVEENYNGAEGEI